MRPLLVLLLVAPSLVTGVVGLPPRWTAPLAVAGLVVLFRGLSRQVRHRLPVSTRTTAADVVGVALAVMALGGALLGPLRDRGGLAPPELWMSLAPAAGAWPVAALALRALLVTGPDPRSRVRSVLLLAATWGLAIAPELSLARELGLLDPPFAVGAGLVAATAGALLAAARLGPAVAAAPAGDVAGSRRTFAVRHEVTGPVGASLLAQAVFVLDHVRGVDDWAVACAVAALFSVGVKLVLLFAEVVLLQGSRQEALTDDLTGLGNRRALLGALRAAGEGPGAALLLLDLDRFKEVNDGLGHLAGDTLLQEVAERLRTHLGEASTLARPGGDEFAVVLEGCDEVTAEQVAVRLGRVLAAPFTLLGRVVHVTASTGVATLPAGPGSGGDDPAAALDAVRRADTAMYAAKSARSGVVVHHAALDAATRSRLQTGEELREAIGSGQLVLHYQPQVEVATGAVRGVEALVRWAHPVRGLLAPDTFLPLAEEHGLLGALTSAVLRDAVAQAARWRAAGTPLDVSVNLSASDLVPDLVDRVADALDDAGLPASALVLEVTETMIVRDPAGAAAVLRDIVDLGALVSIDDYGTGWSSLAQLRRMPVGELKLDRSFTAGLGSDPGSEAIVRTTVDLAHSLGLRLVAEGVEDRATFEHLRRLGCDTSQGYLHSRPLPAPDLTRWLAAHAAAVPEVSPRGAGPVLADHLP